MLEYAKIPVETDNASCAADQTGRPTQRSLRGLDWLNFFLADVQTGVGSFLAIYLAGYGWNEERVGRHRDLRGYVGRPQLVGKAASNPQPLTKGEPR
jgi:hypothetical protein